MIIAAVDPGLKGGIAFYDDDTGELNTFATPTRKVEFMKGNKKRTRDEMDLTAAVELVKSFVVDEFVIEKVNAMPNQGVTGMFRFGENFGQWQGIAAAATGKPPIFYTPQTWKSHYELSSDKYPSLEKARELFPDNLEDFKLKKHDGKAEASLIARYHSDRLNFSG